MAIKKTFLQSRFEALVAELGGKVATSCKDHGAYALDHIKEYGGYVIEKIDDDSTGVSHPFGARRRSAKELEECINFALDVINYKRSAGL